MLLPQLFEFIQHNAQRIHIPLKLNAEIVGVKPEVKHPVLLSRNLKAANGSMLLSPSPTRTAWPDRTPESTGANIDGPETGQMDPISRHVTT